MPSRISNCKFRRSALGGIEFSILCRGRAITAWMEALSDTPAYCAGDIVVVPPNEGRCPNLLLPSSFSGAWAIDKGALRHFGRAEYLRSHSLPAILEYSHGRAALCLQSQDGALIFSNAISPAAAIGIHHDILEVLPQQYRLELEKAAHCFRVLFAEALLANNANDGIASSKAALAALKVVKGKSKLVYGRGEIGDCFIWGFRKSAKSFIVVGIAEDITTLTLQFPFLPSNTTWQAEWIDDNQDFYTKGELKVRPNEISSTTRAVIKALSHGGFVLRLCLKH